MAPPLLPRRLFQSAPGREAGRCCALADIPFEVMGFNPRPAVRPGDAPEMGVDNSPDMGFNPRPAVRPGDADLFGQVPVSLEVSIRARP